MEPCACHPATMIAAVPIRSRRTGMFGSEIMDKERLMGIPSALNAMARYAHEAWSSGETIVAMSYLPSVPRNSGIELRMAVRPSAFRENGVRPAPFNDASYVNSGSPG
jgi:hypothetical protein